MGLTVDIIDGISVRLNEVFGDKYRIYSEEVKQGFKEPCFFIFPLNPSQSPMPASRYDRRNPFDIHYFPESRRGNAEMDDVAERLFDALEYITVGGDPVRGVNMYYEKVSGVLHFFVEYNMFMIRQIQKTPMGEMRERIGVKE